MTPRAGPDYSALRYDDELEEFKAMIWRKGIKILVAGDNMNILTNTFSVKRSQGIPHAVIILKTDPYNASRVVSMMLHKPFRVTSRSYHAAVLSQATLFELFANIR